MISIPYFYSVYPTHITPYRYLYACHISCCIQISLCRVKFNIYAITNNNWMQTSTSVLLELVWKTTTISIWNPAISWRKAKTQIFIHGRDFKIKSWYDGHTEQGIEFPYSGRMSQFISKVCIHQIWKKTVKVLTLRQHGHYTLWQGGKIQPDPNQSASASFVHGQSSHCGASHPYAWYLANDSSPKPAPR